MNRRAYHVIASAEDKVKRLVEECRKDGTLYVQHPKIVAHVSRTGKWLLNAIANLHEQIKRPDTLVRQ